MEIYKRTKFNIVKHQHIPLEEFNKITKRTI